jgi:hypothetical protein
VETIKDFPAPRNLKAVCRFLGMAGFYSRLIQGFSQIAEPPHALKSKNARFIWGDAQQTAFQQLKDALTMSLVLQIPDFSREFTLVCDASDVAISAVLHQKNGAELAPLAYASRLLSPTERKYSAYERECLAVVFGCEKYRAYLEHKEFSLQTDNQALAWLLRHTKDFGRIRRWVLRLAPFELKVEHISGKSNIVADCLTRQYEEPLEETTFSGLILRHLPEAFQSIGEYQKEDPFCNDIYQKVVQADPSVKNSKLLNGTLVYQPSRVRSKRYLLLQSLKPMVLEYFHSSTLSAHLGMPKTLHHIARLFYWLDMRREIFTFVKVCPDCQRAKPAQNATVGLHSSDVVTRPLERIFIDFVGPIIRSRRGNIAILVILDGFSKITCLYPVRAITSVVKN